MMHTSAVVAVYNDQAEAEKAIQALRQSGIDMQHVSLVGREGPGETLSGCYHLGSEFKYCGKLSSFWGGVWSTLFGGAFFAVPSIGPVLVGGPLVRWIVEVLDRAIDVAELSEVGVALHRAGIPRASVLQCEAALRANQLLLIARGNASEVSRASDVLQTTAAVECRVHRGLPGEDSINTGTSDGGVRR
jgi:hypothetical protein